jgi:hypothetical protein
MSLGTEVYVCPFCGFLARMVRMNQDKQPKGPVLDPRASVTRWLLVGLRLIEFERGFNTVSTGGCPRTGLFAFETFPLNYSSASFQAVPRPRDEINQVGCHTAQEADYEQYPTKPQHLPCPPLRGFLYEARAAAIRIKLYLSTEASRVVRTGACGVGRTISAEHL